MTKRCFRKWVPYDTEDLRALWEATLISKYEENIKNKVLFCRTRNEPWTQFICWTAPKRSHQWRSWKGVPNTPRLTMSGNRFQLFSGSWYQKKKNGVTGGKKSRWVNRGKRTSDFWTWKNTHVFWEGRQSNLQKQVVCRVNLWHQQLPCVPVFPIPSPKQFSVSTDGCFWSFSREDSWWNDPDLPCLVDRTIIPSVSLQVPAHERFLFLYLPPP